MKIIIVGGVAGGASAAARMRRLDESAEIIIIERGEYVSFANCGLPYFIGGVIDDRDNLTLQTPRSLKARFNIDVRVNNEVTEIDSISKAVTVKDLKTGEIYLESYDKLILSPGAKPIKPPVAGIDLPGVFTLRNIPDADKIKAYIERNKPKRAVVAGGGAIGIEMAENLSAAGLEVTVVDLSDHILPQLDFDMAAEVQGYLRSKGVGLILGNGIKEIKEAGGSLEIVLDRGSTVADMVIMSVGVRPDTEIAIKRGIRTNKRGAIIVDSCMRTNIRDIYAVGDAVEIPGFVSGTPEVIPLAGPANRQGRIAADNIAGIPSEYGGTQGTSVIKVFDMTVASTGLNEKSAAAKGIEYDKTYIYTASHATYFPGAEFMTIKALWDKKTKKIIGAQAVGGLGVDKRIDVIATAMRFGAKICELTRLELCYAPPFGSAKDPVNMLGFVAENVISGKVKQFFEEDVATLPRDGSVTLLDVRTGREVSRGKIEGFFNMPLDSLRENLAKIPQGKPVYVHCHSGLRSYVACRILTAYGFDCYNLAGGFRLYDIVTSERAVSQRGLTDGKQNV